MLGGAKENMNIWQFCNTWLSTNRQLSICEQH